MSFKPAGGAVKTKAAISSLQTDRGHKIREQERQEQRGQKRASRGVADWNS